MTLRIRMLLNLAALLACLACLAGATAWGVLMLFSSADDAITGLDRLSEEFDAAAGEYQRLDRVYAVGLAATSARALLMSRAGSDPAVLREAGRASELLAAWPDAQPGSEGGAALLALRGAVAQAQRPGAAVDPAGLRAALDQVINHLQRVSAESRRRIEQAQSHTAQRRQEALVFRAQANRRARAALALAGGLTALLVAGAGGIAWMQYRAVIDPLRRLRQGVGELAARRFSGRMDPRGDQEFVALARDFNHMADELDSLYRELESKVAAKSRELVRSERLASVGFLAAGVAHEINNPLGVITGHAELLMRKLARLPDQPEKAEQEQGLRIVCDEAYRCKQIIEKLLTLSHPGWTQPPTQATLLPAVMEEVAAMVRGMQRFGGRTVEVAGGGPDGPGVMAHRAELKQVLLNLAVNALEAVEAGSGRVRMEAATVREGGEMWAELTVTDNGKGMGPATLENLFEPFYTEKRGSEEGTSIGTGLGLSIVHAIVRSQGGHITARSDGPGRGSRFVVRWPLAGASPGGSEEERGG